MVTSSPQVLQAYGLDPTHKKIGNPCFKAYFYYIPNRLTNFGLLYSPADFLKL